MNANENKTYVSATKAWAKPNTFFETLPIHKIQDATLVRFVTKAGIELDKIQLTGAVLITDNGIEMLVRSCPNLTSVNLSGCGKVTDAGIVYLTERCQKLQSLLLSGITVSDHALATLSISNHGLLREIDLSCCRPSGEPNLSNVVLMENSQTHCLITDGGLMKLAEGCPQLESISLAFCRTITGHSIAHMAQHCPRLISINFSECYLISDDGFCAIAQRCQGLQIAELSNCPGLSNAAVQQLLKLSLRSLNVSGCRDLTDGLLAGVHCPSLERINMNNIDGLTDAVLTAMSDGCPALKEIEIAGASITDIGTYDSYPYLHYSTFLLTILPLTTSTPSIL